MQADGFSLDDKRTALGNAEFGTRIAECLKQGLPIPEEIHRANNLPDILRRWQSLKGETRNAQLQQASDGKERSLKRHATSGEASRKRTDQSFRVPLSEIRANDYDLSINRYKEVEYEAVEHEAPKVILERLGKLEAEIAEGRKELEGLLG
jgi:type I restriction enzyme M protein